MLKYKEKNYVCLLDLGFEVIRGKWKAVILCHLRDEPKRFLELQRITCGVSQKMLTEQLRELVEDGLINKTIYSESPPRVEYSLTEKGAELSPALKMIEEWSNHYYNFESQSTHTD